MNKRQRKKRDSKGLTLVFKCNGLYMPAEYIKIQQLIQHQLDIGNVIVLPNYLSLEGIAGGSRVNKIVITKER